jgi:ankyrin repeat protein
MIEQPADIIPDSDSDSDGIGDEDTPADVRAVLAAAENGETDILRDLLRNRPDLVNCRDSDMYTPLHRASYNGHVPAVRMLLDMGADPHSRSSEGWQPLHSAVKWGHAPVAAVLLAAGADINCQTGGGLTPAHIVAMGKGRKIIEFVIFHPDVDLSIRNSANELAYDVARRLSPHHRLFLCV